MGLLAMNTVLTSTFVIIYNLKLIKSYDYQIIPSIYRTDQWKLSMADMFIMLFCMDAFYEQKLTKIKTRKSISIIDL